MKVRIVFYSLLFAALICLFCHKEEIARWTIESNMGEYDKIWVNMQKYTANQIAWANLENCGMLANYDREYQQLVADTVLSNSEDENVKYYKELLLGGFNLNLYLEEHSVKEFLDMTMTLDRVMPAYQCEWIENGEIIYDENGAPLMRTCRFSFWENI